MVTMVLCALVAAGPAEPVLNEADLQYLKDLTSAVIDASRVAPGAKVANYGPNTTGGTLIRPGGRDCYPAFWIRDYAMSLDCLLIPAEEQRHHLLLTAEMQQDEEWKLPSGSVVPAGAIADHITFGGKPIFYPGTVDDYEGQGGPQWGKLPSLDDHFYFVHMAWVYICTTGDVEILRREIRGKTLMHRLKDAFEVPPSRPKTHLVYADVETRGVNFGFYDTVVHTGDLLFVSVLKYQAAREMRMMVELVGETELELHYGGIAASIAQAIPHAFGTESGYLRASTATSAQPDVWGTAYTVYVGAVQGETERAACEALAKSCADGTITWKGMIRHVPTDADFSDSTAWEKAYAAKNTYQNGAYWGTPTGWVCHAVAKIDRDLAARVAGEYVAHLREEDFRKGPEYGAPWECMHPTADHRQNPVYMASVTCPLAALSGVARQTTTPGRPFRPVL